MIPGLSAKTEVPPHKRIALPKKMCRQGNSPKGALPAFILPSAPFTRALPSPISSERAEFPKYRTTPRMLSLSTGPKYRLSQEFCTWVETRKYWFSVRVIQPDQSGMFRPYASCAWALMTGRFGAVTRPFSEQISSPAAAQTVLISGTWDGK